MITQLTIYDVFLTWTVDDYFRDNFSDLFSDPDSISDQNIYVVNKETGLLDRAGDKIVWMKRNSLTACCRLLVL